MASTADDKDNLEALVKSRPDSEMLKIRFPCCPGFSVLSLTDKGLEESTCLLREGWVISPRVTSTSSISMFLHPYCLGKAAGPQAVPACEHRQPTPRSKAESGLECRFLLCHLISGSTETSWKAMSSCLCCPSPRPWGQDRHKLLQNRFLHVPSAGTCPAHVTPTWRPPSWCPQQGA